MCNTSKEWYIGIDFGTSNTCVIAFDGEKGELNSHTLNKGIGDIFLNIPSCIAQDVLVDDPQQSPKILYYYGTEVSKHPILRPFKGLKKAAREVTPNNGLFNNTSMTYPFGECGLDSTLEMGHDDYPSSVTVRNLVIRFLKKVLHIEDPELDIRADTVKKLVIGCPAITDTRDSRITYENTLKRLISECFTGNPNDERFVGTKGKHDGIIRVVPEPELAGITYLYSENKREEKKVLVIDIGGGTTDFSVVEYRKGRPKAVNIGSCETAGNEIDELIFELLPDGIPHSKRDCRRWKENLFARQGGDSTDLKIIPREDKDLTDWTVRLAPSYNLSYSKKASDQCIVLTEGKLYDGTNDGKQAKTTITDIFEEINKKLKEALDDHAITGINTVFFVGGTSVIAPLRDKLVKTVAPYCAAGFDREKDVVDMFGDNQRTIQADGGLKQSVTCYNAVAMGACIQAMGKRLCFKPKVEYTFLLGDLPIDFEVRDASNNDLSVIKRGGVPIGHALCDTQELNDYKYINKSFSKLLMMEVAVDEKNYKYVIASDILQSMQYGMLIVLKRNRAGINCDVFDCFTTEDEIEQKGLDVVTRSLLPIKITKITQGDDKNGI